MKRPADFILMGSLLSCFLLMLAGYAILIRQALKAENKKERLKWVFNWIGHESEMDVRGLRLIFAGATIGAVVLGVGAVFVFG